MKRILSLFLTLLLVFSLAACTQSLRSVDETSEAIAAPTTEPVQPDEVTLDFYGHTDFWETFSNLMPLPALRSWLL